VSLKGFAKLDDDEDGTGVAFSWNAISASDFAKGKTPPFNNWARPFDEGIYIYRSTAADGLKSQIATIDWNEKNKVFGNGNDPVWMWFDKAEIDKGAYPKGSTFAIMVRYKASNNVLIVFDVWEAAKYCAKKGPISLDYQALGNKDLGAVTQVRIQDMEVPKPPKTIIITVIDPDGNPTSFPKTGNEGEDCVNVSTTDFGTVTYDEGCKWVGWYYEDGTVFVPDCFEEDVTVQAVVKCFTGEYKGSGVSECLSEVITDGGNFIGVTFTIEEKWVNTLGVVTFENPIEIAQYFGGMLDLAKIVVKDAWKGIHDVNSVTYTDLRNSEGCGNWTHKPVDWTSKGEPKFKINFGAHANNSRVVVNSVTLVK
jgi:hypothetical protein